MTPAVVVPLLVGLGLVVEMRTASGLLRGSARCGL